MKSIFAMLALTALVAVGSFAEAKAYGSGGCGLGSLMMGSDGNQVMAITTNGTGTQTFGITSGTSNCVDDGVVKKGREARAYIELNQRQLANDISKGGGETVSGLAQLYSCEDKGAFSTTLQKNYTMIFPSKNTSPDHVEASIQSLINSSLNCAG